MASQEYRIEKDSMGEVRVPADALYAAQTQRAVDNFPISDLRFPRTFIRALGLIKGAAAAVNEQLGLMESDMSAAIGGAAKEVEEGRHDVHFPLDIFQTGSGTSTNMNANEVIATLASRKLGRKVHPNDHVNMGQSSNDVIPTAIHVSAYLEVAENLLPGLEHLQKTIDSKAETVDHVVKTGRTHLMDALPIRLSQELHGWSGQIEQSAARIRASLPRISALALGGTAIGTGVNAHPEFGPRVAKTLSHVTGLPFISSRNYFVSLATQDAIVELSGQLKTAAVAVTKIANDLRWMNSGPQAGIAEIALPSLQPGSSIMPGKVNPVIPEAAAMVCAQVFGNDVTITVAGQAGNFQLNVMLPIIAHNILQSAHLLGNAARVLADKAIAGFTVNEERIADLVEKNPILVTALNPVIGYEKGAAVAKKAYAEGRKLKDVALEMTDLKQEELDRLLDPRGMTEGGIAK
jgi:fumarate hydratase class II